MTILFIALSIILAAVGFKLTDRFVRRRFGEHAADDTITNFTSLLLWGMVALGLIELLEMAVL